MSTALALPHPAHALEVIRAPQQAAALFHPLRLDILRLLETPNSAAGVAKALGLPRQRVNYHFKELESQGLIALVEERKKGNMLERLMRRTAQAYCISAETLGTLAATPELISDQFSAAYLVALASSAIRDLAVLTTHAAAAGKRLPTFSLHTDIRFESPAARRSYLEELAGEVARLTAKYHTDAAPGGRKTRLFFGAYPTLTKPELLAEAQSLAPALME